MEEMTKCIKNHGQITPNQCGSNSNLFKCYCTVHFMPTIIQLYLSTILHIALAIKDHCHYHKTLFRILNEVNLIISSIPLTVRKSDVGYCKNYYLNFRKKVKVLKTLQIALKVFKSMFSIWLWLLNFHMFLKLSVALNFITFQRLLQMTIISYEDCGFRLFAFNLSIFIVGEVCFIL